MRVATERETMFMEIGRCVGSVLVFEEDSAPAFLSAPPHSDEGFGEHVCSCGS